MKNKLKFWSTASTLALLFVFLGYCVKFYDDWLFFDTPFQNFVRGDLPSAATHFFKWITQFANPIPLVVLTVVMILFFVMQKKYVASLWLVVNVGLGSGVLNSLLKNLYVRARPDITHLVVERSFSFPSGHAMGSMMLYGTLIFLASQIFDNKNWQRALQIFLGVLIFTIGLSRIYLGVHFPTDILGGWLLGLTWLFATYPLYDEYAFKLRFKQTQTRKK